jgi:hypothetical protein
MPRNAATIQRLLLLFHPGCAQDLLQPSSLRTFAACPPFDLMAAAWFRSLLLPAATEREAPKGAVICEGYLWKQRALAKQSWQKRYFFLRTDGLFYSDHPTFSHKMTRWALQL